MSSVAIRAEGVSKLYHVGEVRQRARYKTLRDMLVNLAGAPLRGLRRMIQPAGHRRVESSIWALRDVSFEVGRGEVLGVIGRNGAGKSTLLKILSRITEPTVGRATIHGRVGSLLEVGTGFHPELTGRENVYLNGAILGMRRAEMDRKLDVIIDFAEVSQFIDTPVKFYSSGMYLRLAFSVAAHLETEILLVDEVLAVGDLRFQKRCLGKMESVAAEGRTVLFVSHNLAALKELCQTALVLEAGRQVFQGPIAEALAFYSLQLNRSDEAGGNGWSRVAVNDGTEGTEPVLSHDPFEASAILDVPEDLSRARLYCIVENSRGDGVMHNFFDRETTDGGLSAGRYDVRVRVPSLWLFPDVYSLHFKLIGRRTSGGEEKQRSHRVILNMSDHSGQAAGRVRASLIPPVSWSVAPVSRESAVATR